MHIAAHCSVLQVNTCSVQQVFRFSGREGKKEEERKRERALVHAPGTGLLIAHRRVPQTNTRRD